MEFLDKWFSDTELKLLASLILFFGLWLVRLVAFRFITRNVKDRRAKFAWRQTITYAVLAAALLLLVPLWFTWFQNIFTLLSVVAAALTIVSKELLLNVFSYGLIVWRGLFDIGDRIQVGHNSGDVIDIGPFYISMAEIGNWVNADEPSGRVIKIPNAHVLTNAVANYSHGSNYLWHELHLELPIASNWEKAKSLLEKILAKENYKLNEEDQKYIRKRNEDVMFGKAESKVYLSVVKDKIQLTLRYLCPTHKRRSSENRIWIAVLQELGNHADIQFTKKEREIEAGQGKTPEVDPNRDPAAQKA